MATSWDTRKNYLLQEIGDFLLLEDGSKISIDTATSWTERTKPSATSWTERTEP